MLKIEDLSFSYGEKNVIENFSLELPSSGIYALMGPSGCGKTTLLYLIAGLSRPIFGSISRKSNRIAYSFQEPRLLPRKSAVENVKFVLTDKRTGNERAEYFLRELGLENEFDTLPNELSGGMKQRVSIARALAYNGDITLLDEPFNGLDEGTKEQVARLLREKAKESLVIIITHSAEDAQLCGAEILDFVGLNKK